MAQNTAGAVESALNIFAGLVTYEDPTALPLGASPDCSDMVFQPGGASSRPCLARYFATPLGVVTVTYAKSYVTPSNIRWTFALDSAGNFWAENLTTAGIPGVLFTTTPGSYCKSVTAFGREYVAISDGLHGTDIPYQLTGLADGTIQIDRVTQDGPGAGPNVASLPFPSVAMVASGSPLVLTVASIITSGYTTVQYPNGSGGYTTLSFYATLTVTVSSGASALTQNVPITIAGNGYSPFNASTFVSQVISDTEFTVTATGFFATPETGAGGTATATGSVTLTRTNNIVAVTTAAAHNLQVGFQVQIAGVASTQVGGGVASISIDNENLPGIATVTTNNPHGLIPGSDINVSITGVGGVAVGGGIASIGCQGEVVTVTTNTAHNLYPGASVNIASTGTQLDTTGAIVLAVTSATVFTYAYVSTPISESGSGTVTLNWPVPDTPEPTYFNVLACPTATTFQIAINYSDGTWTSGTITYAWNGNFFVQSVPSSTTFTYQQYGPNTSTTSVGTVTPYGQAAPGLHQMQVFFINRQGGVTTPSPPVTFAANGGQFISVTNIPIGPPNVIARVIAFTGAQGAFFFYLPTQPQVNGQFTGTATQINDNTTESAIFDFGDATLFDGEGISEQGNNLANQIVLEGALGFGYYGSRLFTYGQRNVIDNLLNMGFDGGYLPSSNTLPTGWDGGGAGTIATGHFGFGWETSGTALTQSMYQDYLGVPIATPNEMYSFRAWLSKAGTVTATISSASTSFSSTVTLTATGAGFLQGNFSVAMPVTIPSDLTLGITGTNSVVVDEMAIIYRTQPFLNTMFASYFDNPEGMDGVSGVIGPQDDTHQVLGLFILRDNLYMLTQDPNGRLHETSQGLTEPADWVVTQYASSSGTVSAFAVTVSQADDATGTGAPAWASWYSINGYQIFGGDEPENISSEIQRPAGSNFPGAPPDLTSLNPAALLTVWSFVDQQNKILYVGIPSGSATAPSKIFVLTYTGLTSAAAIAGSPPVHRSLTGKLIASDLGRKWCPYQLPMNGGAMLYQANGQLAATFFGGNGTTPNTGGAQQFGNIYTLSTTKYTDDDYGQRNPYYTTAGFPDKDTEIQNQLGPMKILSYLTEFVPSGVGELTIQILYGTLANLWPIQGTGYLLSADQQFNLPFGGGQATGPRFFVKTLSVPNPEGETASPSTDNAFSISSMSAWLKKNTRMPDRAAWP